MLKMMFTKRAVQEIATWATLVTPELVLNKDGSLLTVFEFDGVDADSPNPGDITAARDNLDHACRNFDHRVTAWWRMSHRRVKGTIDGEFTSAAAARIDAINQANIGSGKYFKNSHSLALAFTPETGISRVFDKISYHMTVGGKNLFVTMFEAAKDMVLARSAFAFDLTKIQNEIKRFESVIDGFTGGVTRLNMKRLQLQNILSFLHQRANPSTPKRRVRYPVTMLDTHLTETEVTIGATELMFESAHGKVYARIIGVKEWMGFQEAALDVLAQVDAELDVCVMFRFLDTSRASSYIKKIRGFYKVAAFNPVAILKQWATKEEQKNDEGRELLAKEAGDALAKLDAEDQQYGFANISVVVYGSTPEVCEDATRQVVGVIGNAGFGVIQEKTNLFASWSATLPGRWDQQKRLQFVETPAISDIAPLCSVGEGKKINDWLTEQSGIKTGPLTCLPTRHRTLQYVDLHHPGGKAHLLVVGPIGGGKSVLMNFFMEQTVRHGARRIRFDKDGSTRIPTLLGGGRFIDATGRFEAATSVNPLSMIGDEAHWPYVTDWVKLVIEGEDFTCTPQHETDIDDRIRTLAKAYPPEKWRLSGLITLLPAELREQLFVWTEGQKNGRFFDHVEDGFSISDNLSIEMGDLFQNYPVAAALFMDYAFYRIAQILDGKRYTVIEIEEAGFFFTYSKFYARLEIWAVTIRKLNAALLMATQSLGQLARVPNFEILKENIPNIIYLPNSDAINNQSLYRDIFGLTAHQIKMISDAVPNRDYLWVTATQTRMLQAQFPKEALAYLRSDGRAQALLDKHVMSGSPHWQQDYVRDVLASA
ncbi:Conjugative transfer protein TrbE [Candidatus Burkholderia verschuerenii]|uniref:Conjugative transfer protein TrbE n=1 Tax=Candidatus Burkholderia verschuerenii TaxID=242163 RepID=A0A0L0M600_9BURK|nr:VirB4 family type IV secretion system protein [Candidatus Burkholderia verschuerenii]KND57715.1 Conjugative transfer protein TrbE [Candidatus Burkholderia verschuerenii]